MDMSVDLIGATVELEQPLGSGLRTVGTGFLVSDPGPDGVPRVVLITANHVFEKMKGDKATVGFRVEQPDGSWRYAPQRDHDPPGFAGTVDASPHPRRRGDRHRGPGRLRQGSDTAGLAGRRRRDDALCPGAWRRDDDPGLPAGAVGQFGWLPDPARGQGRVLSAGTVDRLPDLPARLPRLPRQLRRPGVPGGAHDRPARRREARRRTSSPAC